MLHNKFNQKNKIFRVKGGLYDHKMYGLDVKIGRYDYHAYTFKTDKERKAFMDEQKHTYYNVKFKKYAVYENTLMRTTISA